jgi:hypothetical protein
LSTASGKEANGRKEMDDHNNEEIVRIAARVVMGAALDLIQADPHQWSTRPCQTCRSVSSLAGRPFGCLAYKQAKEENK